MVAEETAVADTVAAVVTSTTVELKSDIHHQQQRHVAVDNDNDRISLAHERYQQNKILEAYRLLQSVEDKTLLMGIKEQEICNVAIECQNAISDLLEEPDHTAPGSIWNKQGESHGEYDTTIYYKVEDKKLTSRLVTPIQPTVLIPLLSVLNESNLYSDWIPSWTIPFTMGIRTSHQFARIGQLDQIVHLIAAVPWPFLPREVYIQSMVIDEIDEHNYFAIRLFSLDGSENNNNNINNDDDNSDTTGSIPAIPASLSTVQRFDFHGVLLFRPCPKDSQMIEVSFKMCVDPKISMIPIRIINFVTRTVIGTIWGQFLHVAQQVQNGERIHHVTAIQEQSDLYQYIESRVQQLLLSSSSSSKEEVITTE